MRTSLRQPLPNLHCHLEPWLDAAANNRLTPAERLTLERHLCECSFCMARTQESALVDRTAKKLADNGHLSDDLQTRFVSNFLEAVETPPPSSSKPMASRLRVAIAVALLLTLSLRLAEPALLSEIEFPSLWETLHQLVIHDPNYEQIQRSAMIAAEDHLPLAALHKLANAFSAFLAWLALFLIGRHSLLHLCRHHFLDRRLVE